MSIIGFILHSLIGVKIKRRIKFILLAEGSSRCWDRWSSTRNNLAPDFILSLKLECSSGRFYFKTSDELNRRSVSQFPECVLIVP